MKTKIKKILPLALCALIFSTTFLSVTAENKSGEESKSYLESVELIENKAEAVTDIDQKEIKDAYIYSVMPGTPEWNDFDTRYEMMNATQIPVEILENMSTEALAKTVINHPMLNTIMLAYDNSELAFQEFINDFNGAKELMDRGDVAIQLAKLYTETPVSSSSEYNMLRNDDKDIIIDLYTKETILAVPQIYNLLSKDEANALAIIANEKMIEKVKYEDIYGTFSDTFFATRSKITKEDEFFNIKNYDAIKSSSYINKNSLIRDSYSSVNTPNGSSVSVISITPDLTTAQKNAINSQFINNYPKATYMSTSTTNYNCHSYTWYSTSTSNRYWMNDPTKYMTDGSYKNAGYQNSGPGMKMYWPGEHSGHIVARSAGPLNGSGVTVQSKWGQGPLMKHDESYGPYSATNRSVWKR